MRVDVEITTSDFHRDSVGVHSTHYAVEERKESLLLKVFLLFLPPIHLSLLEEGSQGDLASDYRHILFLGGVHEEEFHVGSN